MRMNPNTLSWKNPVLLIFAVVSTVWSEPNAPQQRLFNDYRVISEKNIFLRDRSAMSGYGANGQRQKESPALTGVVQRGSEMTAFFVDPQSQTVTKVRPDQQLGGGKILAIKHDRVVYERAGKQTEVLIGHNLEGMAVVTVSRPDASVKRPRGLDPNGPVQRDSNVNQQMPEQRMQNMDPNQMRMFRQRMQNMDPNQIQMMRQRMRDSRNRRPRS